MTQLYEELWQERDLVRRWRELLEWEYTEQEGEEDPPDYYDASMRDDIADDECDCEECQWWRLIPGPP